MNSLMIFTQRQSQNPLGAKALINAAEAVALQWERSKPTFSSGNGLEQAAHLALILMELYGMLSGPQRYTDLEDYRPNYRTPVQGVMLNVARILDSALNDKTVNIENLTVVISRLLGIYGPAKFKDRMTDLLVHRPPLSLDARQTLHA